MKTKPEWASLTGPELLDEIKQREKLIGEMVGQLFPSILRGEIRDLVKLYAASPFERGRSNCYQDRCENCSFASIGGLDKRTAMEAPYYVKVHGEKYVEEYLAGYRAQAKDLFGDDWETCEFGWSKAITIGGKEGL
jgi:hypothetical protein